MSDCFSFNIYILFYSCMNDNVQSRVYVHLKLVGHVSHFSFVYLFVWLLTLGYWNGLAWHRYCVISCCQGLAKLACVEAVFPNTIWNVLLAVEVFPKCVYVRTVDSRITVFTIYVFCCIFAMVFYLYFVVLHELWGQWRKWQLRPSLPVSVFLMKYFVLGRDA